MNVTIVDYNSGNISSVINSFREVARDKVNIEVTSDLNKIKSSDKVVLPGQGSFKSCVDALNDISGMVDTLNEFAINIKKPLLGICVGLQMFADIGYEETETKGLGWISGQVENLCPDDKNLKIPHMGWNEVNFKRDDGRFSDLNGEDFYFVHSYYFNAKDTDNILATTNYNQPFPSALIKNNIIGTQFHPEKSQRSGVEFIKRFLMWKP